MCDLGLSVWSLHEPVYQCMFSSFSNPNKCSLGTFPNPKGCVGANAFLCWNLYLSRVCPTLSYPIKLLHPLSQDEPGRTQDGCYVNGQKHLKTLRIERMLPNANCDPVISAAPLKVCRDHDCTFVYTRLYQQQPNLFFGVYWTVGVHSATSWLSLDSTPLLCPPIS